MFLQRLLERLSAQQLRAETAADCALLKRFAAVIVEDSSCIQLPTELATIWRGCGGSPGTSQATIKLFVRWDVLNGQLWGPSLTDGRHSDNRSPFAVEDLPARTLYLADLGFFDLERLRAICQGEDGEKRFVVTRLQPGTTLWNRAGHQINLRAILPQEGGEAKELGVLVGKSARLPMRLIIVRVPKDVAEQRRKQLCEAA